MKMNNLLFLTLLFTFSAFSQGRDTILLVSQHGQNDFFYLIH